MKFSIEAVTQLTGISAVSLRNWEKRYDFPRPERSAGGHRNYSPQDIQFLRQVQGWLDQGLTLPAIAEKYAAQFASPVVLTEKEEGVLDDIGYRAEVLYQCLLRFDQSAATQHYAILNAKLSPEQLFDRVFEPMLKKLGIGWHEKRISIAQEHFVSSYIRLKLSAFLAVDFPASQPHRIICTTTSHERHEGGLMLLSAHLKFRGYAVSYFGTDLPMEEMIQLITELEPSVLCLSYSNLNLLKNDIDNLLKLKCVICIGGHFIFDEGFDEFKSSIPEGRIYIANRSSGSEAAKFVELLCKKKE